MRCRHCAAPLQLNFVDLGNAPPSNAYLTEQNLLVAEKSFPLRVLVCEQCWLVQTEDFARVEELFAANYAYFSSYSTSWLTHCEDYVADMVARFGLDGASHVVEIAANDGYLLQYVKARGIPCTGIEPTASTAAVARTKGITVIEDFFGARLAHALVAEGKQADLMVANNVLAHVPDINDFAAGFTILLKPQGVATFEFPHLMRLIADKLFDTIYHEHFSYLSLGAVIRIFATAGLSVFDVDELPTHGGSLRVFAQRSDGGRQARSSRVDALLLRERDAGLFDATTFVGFQACADKTKDDFLRFLRQMKREGRRVVAYGAAAKGNTLLNYAGVGPDMISCVIDRNPAKQGKYLPGSRIPIICEERLKELRPDYIVILPWNLQEEVIAQLDYARTWGASFVTAVPALKVMQ